MENFDPIDVEFLINSDQVKKDAKKVRDQLKGIGDAAEDAAAQVGGLKGPNGDGGGLEKPLEGAGAAAEEAGKKVARAKSNFDGLGFSISQITRELPAFTYSAQTGFLAISNNIPMLADEIGKLRRENDELVASGKKGQSVIGQLAKSFLSWQTVLSVGVTLLTVYGPEIVSFLGNLFKTKKALDDNAKSMEAMNRAYESSSYQKAIKAIIQVRAAFSGAGTDIDKKAKALKLYNETLGDSLGTAKNYNEAEKTFVEKSGAYVKALLYRAAAAEAVNEASKELIRLTKEEDALNEKIEEKGGTRSAVSTFATKNLRQERNAVKKEAKEIETSYNRIISNLNNKAEELASAFNLDLDGDGKGGNNLVGKRKELLRKLADLDAEYARKKLNSDQEEVQALKDKFDKIRRLVEEFNNDPKNANVKIDLGAFNALEQNAIADLTYQQDTKKLQEELEAQKRIFEDFEEYKKQFGIAKAKEQFAEQLKEFGSYAELIRKQYDINADAFEAVAKGTATGGQQDRVRLIEKEAEAEIRLRNKQYTDLLAGLMSYEEKRTKLISDYQEKRALLISRGNLSEAQELERQHKASLGELDDEYAKSTDAYKALIRGVENLSDTAARAVIDNAKKMVGAMLAAGTITEELAAEINNKIQDLENELDNKTSKKLSGISDKIHEISGAFLNLGDSLETYNEGLADTITTIGELGNVAGEAAMAAANLSGGNIYEGIAGAINALAGIFTIGAKARESARRAQEELVRIQQVAEDGERRINEIMRQRNITKSQEVELTLKGVDAQRQALQLAQQQLVLDEKRLLRELQAEEYISGSHKEKYGGFLGIGRKTKVVNDYASLLGLTFEEIEKLYEKGKLEDRASELFEQLRQLREEGEDINSLLGDLEKQSAEIFTGTTSNALADSIVDGLKQGYDSFEDFADSIEGLLQGAILNSIKYNVLEEPLQNLYEQFAKYAESEGGLSQAESDAIRAAYQEQVQKAIDQYEQLSGILDADLLEGQKQTSGLQGAIRRELTEETASELTGLFRGQFDITKRQLQLGEKHFELEQRHFDATLRMIQLSALIEQNTAGTVTELKAAVLELRTISKNTKPSQTSRDLGLG